MRIKRFNVLAILCAAWWVVTSAQATASDACSTRAVITEAKVSVSDGSQYRIETYFHSRNAAAIRFIREHGGLFAVDGPFAWINNHSSSRLAPQDQESFTKAFALGHQFHAMLMYFDDVMGDVRAGETVEFSGDSHRAKTGIYPYGGTVHLVDGEKKLPNPGMRLELDGMPSITVTFGDWGDVDGTSLPHSVRVDDGERTFDYVYTKIEISERSPLWFFNALKTPVPDEVAVYRLHRRLLAAHCLGDAGMIAGLTAPEALLANRGELSIQGNDDMKSQFKLVFEKLRYTEYHDLVEPVIEISTGGDMAWAGVTVRAVGERRPTGAAFDDQWAWVMLARKIGGRWVNAGIASSRTPR